MKKYLLIPLILSFLFPFSVGAVTKQFQVDTGGTLTTSLVSYFKMEDATDYFGTSTLTNYATTTFTSGKVNNAGTFNGSSQYLTADTGFVGGTAYSVALWAKSDGTQTAYANIISRGVDGTSGFDFQYNHPTASNMNFFWGNGSTNQGLSYAYDPNTDTTWHQLAFTYDGEKEIIYKDGAVITSSTAPIDLGTYTTLWFGQEQANTGRWWLGQIDETGFWDKVLTQTEITDLYNGGAGQTMVEVGGVVAPKMQVIYFQDE